MFNKENDHRQYRAYLVRMWQVGCDGQVTWRASAEDAHSGERRAFADLPALFTFLQEATLTDQTTNQNKE